MPHHPSRVPQRLAIFSRDRQCKGKTGMASELPSIRYTRAVARFAAQIQSTAWCLEIIPFGPSKKVHHFSSIRIHDRKSRDLQALENRDSAYKTELPTYNFTQQRQSPAITIRESGLRAYLSRVGRPLNHGLSLCSRFACTVSCYIVTSNRLAE